MKFWLFLYFFEILPIMNSMQKSCETDHCFKKETNVEVSAVLVPCHPHVSHSSCHSRRKGNSLGADNSGFGELKLKDCIKKVLVSVSLTNVQHTNVQSEYVVIDEVYDCQTGIKEKLLYPYVLKIRRTPLLQTYRLDHEGSVKERSRIIECGVHKKQVEKLHCDVSNTTKASCFNSNDNNGHSTNTKNRRREADVEEDEEEAWNENNNERRDLDDYDIDVDMEAEDSYQLRFDEDEMDERFDRRKRESLDNVKMDLPFGVEGRNDIHDNIRSASKTEDSMCPGEGVSENASTIPKHEENWNNYYAATDNMKYHIYKLQEPSFTHNLSIEIFEKHTDAQEKLHWNTLTDEHPVILCTSNTESWCSNKSCVASYKLRGGKSKNSKMPYDNIRLLIPEFPHLRGGPGQFLVIPSNMFTSKEDFSGARQRISGKNSTESTSMKHSPIWFRRADLEKEEKGNNGNFFLKYFAKLPENPIVNLTDDSQNLTIYFEGSEQNVINVEMKADFNIILKQHASAVITEVYVDATNVEKTEITVKVTNSGLVNGVFYVFLTDCPLRLPADFSNIASSSAVISPQQQHVFSMTVLFALPKRRFYCSIDVKNHREDVIAFRRIRFQRRDRCVCMWHCSCTCLDTDKGLKCKPLSIDHYNAAGFHGGLPMASKFAISTTFVQEYVSLFFNLCLATIVVLIIMGVLKALLGLCFVSIGNFGLRWYLGLPKSIDEYYESNLKKTPEQYDNLDWPTDPNTKQRSRLTTRPTEFSINTIFFLLFPIIFLHAIVIKLVTPRSTNEKLKVSKYCSCDCFFDEYSDENISPPTVSE